MRYLIVIGILTCFPLTASAQKVAVLTGEYHLVWDETASEERARIVSERVCKTIENAGLQCIRRGEACADKECLESRLAALRADEAVAVSVEQTGAEYDLRLMTARGESAAVSIMGPMSEALEELERLVKKTVVEPLEKKPGPAQEEAAAKDSHHHRAGDAGPAKGSKEKKKRSRIGPAPFWVVLGVTSSAIVSWAIVEGIGHSRWQDFKARSVEERTTSEKDELQKLRTADWALLAVSGVGLVALTTLAAFTDFKKKKRANIGFAPAPRGGALFLSAEF